MDKIILMEISQAEAEMIVKERAKAERQSLRVKYVNELNALIQRAKADGFTIAANRSMCACSSITSACVWSDAAGSYIGLQ